MKFTGQQLLQVVKNLDGKEVMESEDRKLTVKQAARIALTTTFAQESQQQQNQSPEDKFKCYELAMRLLNVDSDGEIELTSEEISLIKKKAGNLGVEVMGFLYYVLEGKNTDFKVVHGNA